MNDGYYKVVGGVWTRLAGSEGNSLLVGAIIRSEVVDNEWSFHIENMNKEQYDAVLSFWGLGPIFAATGPDRLVPAALASPAGERTRIKHCTCRHGDGIRTDEGCPVHQHSAPPAGEQEKARKWAEACQRVCGKCVGKVVHCAVCGLRKKPVGRSAPDVMANSLCNRDCDGYACEPHPGQLWPGETCENFGWCEFEWTGESDGKV